ncbi:MAG: hypothetical protein KDB07_02220 [Planctomycetes bacterium]|nr:hypothetical protein [Planctomycetota bacterium]
MSEPSANPSAAKRWYHFVEGNTPCKRALFDALGYQPHLGQAAFHDSSARFKVLIAGTRFGKSLAAAREALALSMRIGSRGWIVAPSYRLAEKEFRYILSDLDALDTPFEVRKLGGHSGPSILKTHWQSEVLTLSAQHPETLLGEEVDWMLLSEASQLEGDTFARYLRGRLTSRGGALIVPTTPAGFNWVHELYLRGADPAFPQWESWHFRTIDNPLIPADEVEEARLTMPAERFREQYLGAFTSEHGFFFGDACV